MVNLIVPNFLAALEALRPLMGPYMANSLVHAHRYVVAEGLKALLDAVEED